MALQQQNPFLSALSELYDSERVNDVIEVWTKLLEQGYQQQFLKSRNLMARVCESGDMNLLEFLIANNFVFDKLCVYICSHYCEFVLLKRILEYQPDVMEKVDLQHLMADVEDKEEVVDFFKNLKN